MMSASETLKEKRNKNWTTEEQMLLAEEFSKRKEIMKGKFSKTVSSKAKQEAWGAITAVINAANPAVKRTTDEVQKKWYNISSSSKQELSLHRREVSKTGTC